MRYGKVFTPTRHELQGYSGSRCRRGLVGLAQLAQGSCANSVPTLHLPCTDTLLAQKDGETMGC